MRSYRPGIFRKSFDRVARAATTKGLPFGGVWLLTTTGRRTGAPRTNPVRPISVNGKRWLVAPYGPVAWVHNARAAGEVELRHGSRVERHRLREASPSEAGDVLRAYVRVAPVVLPFFQAGLTSSADEFAREAHDHPVFELLPSS